MLTGITVVLSAMVLGACGDPASTAQLVEPAATTTTTLATIDTPGSTVVPSTVPDTPSVAPGMLVARAVGGMNPTCYTDALRRSLSQARIFAIDNAGGLNRVEPPLTDAERGAMVRAMTRCVDFGIMIDAVVGGDVALQDCVKARVDTSRVPSQIITEVYFSDAPQIDELGARYVVEIRTAMADCRR